MNHYDVIYIFTPYFRGLRKLYNYIFRIPTEMLTARIACDPMC
jgi:hypothetical protein